MRNLLLALFLTGFSFLFAQGTTSGQPLQTATVVDTARLNAMKDSIRWRLTQFFDIDMFDKCLQVRQISNIKGLSLLKKNQSLADSVSLFEKGYETNIFVNSFVNSDQLWPRLLFNKDKTTDLVADTKNAPAVGFDIRFTPQGTGDGRVFNVDILNKPSQGLLDGGKQNNLLQVTNQGLGKPFGKISPVAKDSVNEAMFRGIAALREMFEEQTNECNIAQVTFEPCAGQQYGFDVVPHEILAGNYEELNVKGRKYEVPWKSVAANMHDSVRVKLVLRDKNAPTHQIGFRSSDPGMVATPKGDGSYLISFGGGADKSEQTIEAYYQDTLLTGKVKETVVGKLKIKSYAPAAKEVVPVLLNGVSFNCNTAELEKVLNDIYKQAAVKWTVATPVALNVNKKVWDNEDGDGTLLVETSPFRRYSSEMQAIIDAMGTAPDPETYYVIITDLPNSMDYTGYMPLKAQYAFFFTKTKSHTYSGGSRDGSYQTIAHELGHGAFYMKHIDDEYKINDATDNLMNRYAAGTALWKPQWDWMGDPSWRLYMFQKEEEGAMMIVVNIAELNDFANKDASGNILGYTFLTPSGKLITLPPTISEVYFSTGDNWEIKEGCTGFSLAPIGTLTHFVIKKDNKETKYRAKKECGSDNFIGYQDDNNNSYQDELSYNQKPSKYIIGTPCLKESAVMFKAIQATETIAPTFEQVNYGNGTLQPFDYIVSKTNWQSTAKYINAKMSPALGQEAHDFIYSREKSAQGNSVLYPYIFTHAHQINQYPEVYNMCWIGKALNNEDFDDFLIKMMSPKDSYGNTVGNTLQTSISYWKEKGYSTYYEYNQVLEQFKNLGTQDGTTILELLKKTKDYSCLWKAIKTQGRINAIKKLVFEVHVDGDEEQLLIDLFNTVPDQTQAQTLYNDLQNDNSGLLAELDKSIDGANHVRYYTALSNLLVLAKGKTELQNQIKALEVLTTNGITKPLDGWAKEKVFFWLSPTFVQSFLNGNRKLMYEDFTIAKNGQVTFTIEQIGLAWSLGKYPVSLNPLDLVRVDFKTSSQALNTTEGNSIYIPAVSLSILANEQWKQEMNDAINVGFIIGTAGSGALAQGGRTALIAAGEITLTATAMTIDSYRDEIKAAGGESFIAAFDAFNTALTVYQVSKALASLPGTFQDLKKAYNSLKNKNPNIASKIDDDLQKTLAKGEEIFKVERITLSDDLIITKGGGTNAWNKLLNEDLYPNSRYKVDGYLFETDELGRVKKVTGELQLVRREPNTYQQGASVSKKGGIQGVDDGGHLIGAQFYGPGEQINYLPMNNSINRAGGDWYYLETQWSKALKEGKLVEVEIRPIFEGSSKRPVAFEVDYKINSNLSTTIIENLTN
ncbi:MAG: DNA/RNA non-specific endonuclease [Breznakibacter sp.]